MKSCDAALVLAALLLSAGTSFAAAAPETGAPAAPCDTTEAQGLRGYDLVDQPAEILGEVPRIAAPRINGLSDTLWVRVLIGCDGSPIEIRGALINYVGGRRRPLSAIDSVAIAALSGVRFKPAVMNGKFVPVWGCLPIPLASSEPRVPASTKTTLYNPLPNSLLIKADSLLEAYFEPAPRDTAWKRIDPGKVLSFLAPPGTRVTPGGGIDSFVGNYLSAGMEISFDYGSFTGQNDEGAASVIDISGLPATLRTLGPRESGIPYTASLYVRLSEPAPGRRIVTSAETKALGFWIECLSERDLNDAVRLLRSVEIHVKPHVARASISDTLRWIGPGKARNTDRIPEFVAKAFPEYPPEARAAGAGGTVVVEALVGPDGRATDLRIVVPVAARLEPARVWGLDESAMDAVRASVFRPALRNGKPMGVRVALSVKFVPQ